MDRKKTAAKGKTGNGFWLFRAVNITKHTVFYWSLLLAVSGALLALELLGVHRYFAFVNTGFWQNVIVPFCRDLDANFINLYVSQISTTFLVTAFLSFLGGKEDPIYWTSAMEYKLINPKGTSLRDITWYCLGTLVTSLVAVFFRAVLMFVFSFGINLIGLSVITCRMILAFFAREEIKKQLQQDFIKADDVQKQLMFEGMEEHIVRAAHNHDVGYLRECVDFFRQLEEKQAVEFTTTHFERLQWFFQVIPDQLAEVRWGIFVRLCTLMDIDDLVGETGVRKRYRDSAIPELEDAPENAHPHEIIADLMQKVSLEIEDKNGQLKLLEKKCKTPKVKKGIHALKKEVEQLQREKRRLVSVRRRYTRACSPEKDNRRRILAEVMRMLSNNLTSRTLTERDAKQWRGAAVALAQRNIEELSALCLANKVEKPNFHRDFKEFVYLLKEAYDHHRLLDDYIAMLHDLHRVVGNGIDRMRNVTGICGVAQCYEWKETEMLFRCLCDNDALIERIEINFLLQVYHSTVNVEKSQKALLYKLVSDATRFTQAEKTAFLNELN